MNQCFVGEVVPEEVGALVTINDRHLNVHQDNVGLQVDALRSSQKIVQCFFSIPCRSNLKAQSADRLGRNLLVYGATTGQLMVYGC